MDNSEKAILTGIELLNKKLLEEHARELDNVCKRNIETAFLIHNRDEIHLETPCDLTPEHKEEIKNSLRDKKKRISLLKIFVSSSIGLWILNFIYEFIKKKSE